MQYATANTECEIMARLHAFRHARDSDRRCLVRVRSFVEWQVGAGSWQKQGYVFSVHPRHGRPTTRICIGSIQDRRQGRYDNLWRQLLLPRGIGRRCRLGFGQGLDCGYALLDVSSSRYVLEG